METPIKPSENGEFRAVLLQKDRKSKRKIVEIDIKKLKREDQQLLRSDLSVLLRLRSLKHSNIIPVYNFTENNKLIHVETGYIEGRTLQEIIVERKNQHSSPLGERHVLVFLYQMALAGAFIHDLGIVHKYLRPESFVMTENFQITLNDLGIGAQIILRGGFEAQRHLYSAPEVVSGALGKFFPVDFPGDVWSLGVIAYELLTLRLPFDAKALEDIALKRQEPQYEALSGSSEYDVLRTLIGTMLYKKAHKRPTCKEVLLTLFLLLRSDDDTTDDSRKVNLKTNATATTEIADNQNDNLKKQKTSTPEPVDPNPKPLASTEKLKSAAVNPLPEHRPVINEPPKAPPKAPPKEIYHQPPTRTRGELNYCDAHATESGCYSSYCGKIHACARFILGMDCSWGRNRCKFGHEFNTEHNNPILQQAGYSPYESNEIRAELMRNRASSFRLDSFYD